MIKKAIKKTLNHFGYSIIKKTASQKVCSPVATIQPIQNTMKEALNRANKRGVLPNSIIDVGAAQGTWSLSTLKFWPEAEFVLFEPLAERKTILDSLTLQYPNFNIVNKGAGKKEEVVDFYVTNDLDGSGIADNGTHAKKTKINITTIDKEVARLNLQPPFLIKLDTHGYEVPIIEGALSTLKKCCLVIIECYGYQIAPNSLLFWQMCQHMENIGFRIVDIVDICHRPNDLTFWQCDAVFAPITDENFKHSTYNY